MWKGENSMQVLEVDALIIDRLKELALGNEQVYRSRVELARLNNPELDIAPLARNDGAIWAAGHFTIDGHGYYADFEGKFTSGQTGDFHINGRLYGLIFGSSGGAALLCVGIPYADRFFDRDYVAALAEGVAGTTIQFFNNVDMVGTMTSVSFGAVAALGGTLRATKY
jgi:hypothetical protein